MQNFGRDIEHAVRAAARPPELILELCYFVGKLGRENVCVLAAEDVELPSDIPGIAWDRFDQAGAW